MNGHLHCHVGRVSLVGRLQDRRRRLLLLVVVVVMELGWVDDVGILRVIVVVWIDGSRSRLGARRRASSGGAVRPGGRGLQVLVLLLLLLSRW